MRFLGIFILFISVYQLFITLFGYGILGGAHLEQITIIKEIIRWIATIWFALANSKLSKKYFHRRKKVWITWILLIIYSLWISLIQHKSPYHMLIGIKYDFHFIFVFLSATLIGFLLSKKLKQSPKNSKQHQINTQDSWANKLNTRFSKIIFYSQYFLVLVVFLWFVLQILKFTNPDRFFKIGYWPIGDFVFGHKPPIYYRTGPGGTARRQGLFSGPNNYGYFLVSILPLVLLRRKGKKSTIKNLFLLNPERLLYTGIIILFLLAIGLTLSRTALIGTLTILIIHYKSRIQQHKKQAVWLWIIALIALLWLSIRKWWSTMEHITHKINGIQQIIQQPLWHGLWTAWPAIHHGWSILPENYYLQVMADIGTVGFLIRALLIFQFLKMFKLIQIYFLQQSTNTKLTPHDEINQAIFLHRKYLSIGRSWLLIMGMFLHVFEDSMVNYLFFIPFGILTGYLSAIIKIDMSTQSHQKHLH